MTWALVTRQDRIESLVLGVPIKTVSYQWNKGFWRFFKRRWLQTLSKLFQSRWSSRAFVVLCQPLWTNNGTSLRQRKITRKTTLNSNCSHQLPVPTDSHDKPGNLSQPNRGGATDDKGQEGQEAEQLRGHTAHNKHKIRDYYSCTTKCGCYWSVKRVDISHMTRLHPWIT